MKSFAHLSERLAQDANGRLYDTRAREMVHRFSRLGSGTLAAAEAMAALRMAGHGISSLTDRWAEPHGLSEGRLRVCFILRRSPDHRMPLGELAEMLQVSPRNVTGLVDHLEAQGLVTRVPDAEDRRSIQAQLTAEGVAKIEAIWKEALRHQVEIVQGFSEEELAQLRHLCLRLVQNIAGRMPAPAPMEEKR
jgi:DNA-binding MarR family transcriptional regulator